MDLDANLPSVHCSPAEFNQVVLNIVVNAAHAIARRGRDGGKGKGKIRVKTRSDGEWAVVEISDSGAGMPAHVQQRIFEPFFTTKEVGKGTGQGLAIAHNVIVDKHGGTIKVASAPGKGTSFILLDPHLPRGAEESGLRARIPHQALSEIVADAAQLGVWRPRAPEAALNRPLRSPTEPNAEMGRSCGDCAEAW